MTTDAIGGVWTYALDLSRALRSFGVEVTLASMGGPLNDAQRRQAQGFRVHESTFRLEWMQDPWEDVQEAGEWLLSLAKAIQPDLIHLNGYTHAQLSWSAPCIVVGHSCVLSWWSAVKRETAPFEWREYRKRVAEGLQAADFVVAPSWAMLSELNHYYGPLPKALAIANGRDHKLYSVAAKEEFILSAGRVWDEAKNLSIFDEISTEWPIYIAGDARHPSGVMRAPRQARLLGPLNQEDLAGFYSRASIYCSPALYEPFGLSVLEAAMSGCALVLADIPSLRENWREAALFVPPDDPVAIQTGLDNLIHHQDLRHSLAAAALERSKNFTIERMVEAYLCIYRKVLAGMPAAATQ